MSLGIANAKAIGAGHSFLVLLRNCSPINVLPAIRQVPEVCWIKWAIANPVEVILAETAQGRYSRGRGRVFSERSRTRGRYYRAEESPPGDRLQALRQTCGR